MVVKGDKKGGEWTEDICAGIMTPRSLVWKLWNRNS